jgi:hypothetical protein
MLLVSYLCRRSGLDQEGTNQSYRIVLHALAALRSSKWRYTSSTSRDIESRVGFAVNLRERDCRGRLLLFYFFLAPRVLLLDAFIVGL